jgi:hypothetical protein
MRARSLGVVCLGVVCLGALFAACTGFVSEPREADGPHAPAPSGRCVPGVPETSRLPRLSHAQYDNTVQDLLFLADARPSTALPPQTIGSIDERAWEGYQAAAATLAATAMAGESRERILPCEPSGDGSACAQEMITSFGRRAFRRPLTEAEVARFAALYAQRAELTEGGTFEEGIQLVLEAFLQSPSFLMRVERSAEVADGVVPLSGYEVANRLSYMLWNTMPDDALLDAAAEGRLSSAADIRAEAERMLDHPRARAMVTGFHRHWLGIEGTHGDRWSDIVRDPARFPDFDPSMSPLLVEETLRFADHVVFERGGSFGALLTDSTAFVNRELAPLYGLSPEDFGDELEPTTLDPQRRAGVFTRLGFLASHAMFDRTSPILRGAFIQQHVLCVELGVPPPGAEMTPLPQPGPDVVTTRDRVTIQTSPPACAVCHRDVINPPGFAFESYDAVGAWRDTDNGAPVDASGEAPIGADRAHFDGAVELSAAIASAPEAQACYTRYWVEYAYARTWTDQDRCVVEELSARLGEDGYSIRQLLVDLTQTESFRARALETSR